MATSGASTLRMRVGAAMIHITNDHEFFNGWEAGYLAFHMSDEQAYSDADLFALMYAHMFDTINSPLYNAGYITAWLNALMGGGFQVLTPEKGDMQ